MNLVSGLQRVGMKSLDWGGRSDLGKRDRFVHTSRSENFSRIS